MAATQTTNNNSIRSILKKEKLKASNFLDWYRNLRIVLRNEQKLHHLEEALPEAPPATATAAVRNAYTRRVAEQQEVACLMLVSMTPEIQKNLEDRPAFEILQELKTMFQQQAEQELFENVKAFHACKQEEGQSVSTYVLKMKAYLDQMERLGYPMPLVLGVNMILTSLSKDSDQFVQNYNMHDMGKTIPELHAMLKLTEKGIAQEKFLLLSYKAKSNPETIKSQARAGKAKRQTEKASCLLVPSCFAIFDLEPLSLSFDFVFSSEISKSLSFHLDRLCRLAILCLDQHAYTLHHLESLLTISLDRLDIFEGRSCISEFVRNWNEASPSPSLYDVDYGFVICLNLGFAAVLAVLVTGASQSRQHGKSESDSHYLSD
ncbi:hypothetical protein Tco_0637641, partial [Tanacetum coccineum]